MQSINPISSPRATSPIQPRENAPKDVYAEIKLIQSDLSAQASQHASNLISRLEKIKNQCSDLINSGKQLIDPELSQFRADLQFLGCNQHYIHALPERVNGILKVVRALFTDKQAIVQAASNSSEVIDDPKASDNSLLQMQGISLTQQGVNNNLASEQQAVATALYAMIAAQPEVCNESLDSALEAKARWLEIRDLLCVTALISYKQYEKLALMMEAKIYAQLFHGLARNVSQTTLTSRCLSRGLLQGCSELQQSSKALLELRHECERLLSDAKRMIPTLARAAQDLEAMSNEKNADLELVAILKTRLQLEIVNYDAWKLKVEYARIIARDSVQVPPSRYEEFCVALTKFREYAKTNIIDDNVPVDQNFYRNVVHWHLMEIPISPEYLITHLTRNTVSTYNIKRFIEQNNTHELTQTLNELIQSSGEVRDICQIWKNNVDMIHDNSVLSTYQNILAAYQTLCDICNHKLKTLQLIEGDKDADLSTVSLVIDFVHKQKNPVISGLLESIDIRPQVAHEMSLIIDGLLKAVIAPNRFSAAQKKATATTSVLNIFRQQIRNALKYKQFEEAAYYLEIAEAIKRELNPAHCFNIADYQ